MVDRSTNSISFPMYLDDAAITALAAAIVAAPPTGGATSAKQDTGNTSLASIDGKLPATLGPKTGALSFPIVPPTDTGFILKGVSTAGVDGAANAANYLGGTDGNPLYTFMRPSDFNGASWDGKRKSNGAARMLAAANSTNATSVKASAGDLFRIELTAAAAVFLKLYNKASAPTVGTDTPIWTRKLVVGDNVFAFPGGHYFSTGIAYALTGVAADNDTTAVAANDVICMDITYA